MGDQVDEVEEVDVVNEAVCETTRGLYDWDLTFLNIRIQAQTYYQGEINVDIMAYRHIVRSSLNPSMFSKHSEYGESKALT